MGVFLVTLLLTMLLSNIALANDPYKTLTEYIHSGKGVKQSTTEAGNRYERESGGYYKYTDLVTKDGLVDEGTFGELKSKEKEKLLQDMIKVADNAVATNDAVNEKTKTSWLNQLQQQPGIGTRLLNTLLSNTKPDYVSANRIYEPFSGLVGTLLGLGAIIVMAGISLNMVTDISWIAIPFFRNIGGNNPNEGKEGGFNIISYEAISAVREAESGEGSGSTNKIAVGIYLRRRVVMLIVLGVCLLYLVQGQIFTLVGWILDLFSGFVGF